MSSPVLRSAQSGAACRLDVTTLIRCTALYALPGTASSVFGARAATLGLVGCTPATVLPRRRIRATRRGVILAAIGSTGKQQQQPQQSQSIDESFGHTTPPSDTDQMGSAKRWARPGISRDSGRIGLPVRRSHGMLTSVARRFVRRPKGGGAECTKSRSLPAFEQRATLAQQWPNH